MGNFQTGYEQAPSLEEGCGDTRSIAFPTIDYQAQTCVDGVHAVIQGEEIGEGDTQDHPNLQMQWKWTVVSERDTE
jgi:hypothetical protein